MHPCLGSRPRPSNCRRARSYSSSWRSPGPANFEKCGRDAPLCQRPRTWHPRRKRSFLVLGARRWRWADVSKRGSGAGGEDRTPDLRFTKPLHYRCATPAPGQLFVEPAIRRMTNAAHYIAPQRTYARSAAEPASARATACAPGSETDRCGPPFAKRASCDRRRGSRECPTRLRS